MLTFSQVLNSVVKGVSYKSLTNEVKTQWHQAYKRKKEDYDRRVAQINHKIFNNRKVMSGRMSHGFTLDSEEGGVSRGTSFIRLIGSRKTTKEVEYLGGTYSDLELVANELGVAVDPRPFKQA